MSQTKLLETRTDKAVAFFEQGYNCSQAVFMAYADLYGIDIETAAKLGTSFGGGMGRLREVCGAVSGACLVLSLHYPAGQPGNKISKDINYKAVQRLAKAFKTEMGSYICADLLHLKKEPQSPESSKRTAAYYQSRPCSYCVSVASRLLENEISSASTTNQL